jgi:hypothetical protein
MSKTQPLQMPACVLISATAAVDFGVSGLSICENPKLANETPNRPKIYPQAIDPSAEY